MERGQKAASVGWTRQQALPAQAGGSSTLCHASLLPRGMLLSHSWAQPESTNPSKGRAFGACEQEQT